MSTLVEESRYDLVGRTDKSSRRQNHRLVGSVFGKIFREGGHDENVCPETAPTASTDGPASTADETNDNFDELPATSTAPVVADSGVATSSVSSDETNKLRASAQRIIMGAVALTAEMGGR